MTPRDGSAINAAAVAMDADGLAVSQQLPAGTLVEGGRDELLALEDQGMRVKLLADTNLLRIGAHVIDIEDASAAGDDALPAADAAAWRHYLVQCAAPPTEDWIREIEGRGIDVVEPVSAYGLFVVGDAADVTALRALPFITWTGPFLPAYRIDASAEGIEGRVPLIVAVYPATETPAVAALLAQAGATPVAGEAPAPYGGTFGVLRAEVSATTIPALAAHPSVRWIEYAPPHETFGEREAQIVAENLDAGAPPATAPVTGYGPWLTGLGLSGTGTRVAIVDTGVDANAANNASGHTDLRGRQVAFVDYTGGTVVTDTNGHGTHVAGIAVGSAATGQVEAPAPDNFLWGQGMAPQASYVTQNFLLANPQPNTSTLIEDSAANGADVMNNSWGGNDSPGSGYTAQSRTIDRGVRDANGAAAGVRNLVIVCAAGNDGGSDGSISRPHESKNDIVVGNSLTRRPNNGFPGDDIRGISGSSSRGPTLDGRILPTVVAPGTDVSSAFSRTSTAFQPIPGTGVADPGNPAAMIDQYLSLSGTSMAAPAVTGACALVVEWWRQTRSGKNPSPALVKALLVNTAEDLAGGENWRGLNRTSVDKAGWSLHAGSVFRRTLTHTPNAVLEGSTALTQVGSLAAIMAPGQWFFDAPTMRLFVRTTAGASPGAGGVPTVTTRDSAPLPHIPNGHQGWGRVSLENILLQAPASDRGPRIISDESHAFTANGQEHMIRVAPVDPARPLRITVAWTDAAAAVGSNPALVNDLDLEVTELASGKVFKGNVFANGFSTTGGTFDDRNNVECAYIQNPTGVYEVRVIAASITASARPDILTPWQDFALVVDNAEVPDTGPVSVVPVIDRSGSMVAYDYVATTRTASKQFIGLLGIDDELGIVSFGDDGAVEFPAGPALHTITGQPVAGADAAIDGIGFGGCTFMGDGIVKGRDLLAGATNPRGLVLFSDGYDNRGCDSANAAKPSAQAAAATLLGQVSLHTCAMGPASDQALLSGLARNGGRYYYMPTIDDLFEIYNYIRGQVSGDAVSVIASAQASTSQVPVMVDALAETATITVAWADPEFRFASGTPRKQGEVSIRLRDPSGRLLHPHASQVHRVVGPGYVVFKLHDPAPGLWQVLVSTVSKGHLRYTVGGFCDSRLRLNVKAGAKLAAGKPLAISATVLSGKTPIGARMTASVLAPSRSLAGVLRANRDALANLQPPRDLGTDGLPSSLARLATLRRRLAKAGKPDPFATKSANVKLSRAASNGSATLSGRFAATDEKGTYNVVVRASGVDPASGARFTRQELVSVLVG